MTALLAISLFLRDHDNEFLLVLFPMAIPLLGAGVVMAGSARATNILF